MAKEHGLKTLGDYRRTAKNSLFNPGLKPNNKDASFCDAIKTALSNCRGLIIQSRIDPSILGTWEGIIYPNSKYEMRNYPLFESIKLMEFAITYNEVQSTYELLPNWPKRPDVKISVFTSAGISYLDAAFKFVHEWGRDIIGILQSAYKEHTKEGHVIYGDPFEFLNETPTVDNLEINPVPDIIIKTWYNSIVMGVKKEFPESQFPKQRLEAEFNQIHTQLEHELDLWKNGNAVDDSDEVKPVWTRPLGKKQWAEVFGVSVSTITRWFKGDKPKYKNKQISPRKWAIRYKDLPAEVVARVTEQAQ